jgi:hypothetical protein
LLLVTAIFHPSPGTLPVLPGEENFEITTTSIKRHP